MNQDEDHLRLLTIFHYVCAALGALFACIPVIHLLLGLAMVFAPEKFGHANQRPPEFLGWMMIGVASMLILAGWVYAVLLACSGYCLGRRTHYTFCFVMACVACLFMPFGTVLGIFTIIVLSRPSVKALFGVGGKPA